VGASTAARQFVGRWKTDTIVGFKIGNALVDELDVLKADKARQAWRKIIARMRYKVDGLRNGIDVTTT
jgi:hypothetical protein